MRRRAEAILVGVVAILLMAADGTRDATVRKVVGQVDVALTPDSPWRPAQVGEVLPAGAALRTGAASRAELELERDGAVARIFELSLARVPAGERRIDLERGAASFDVQPRPDSPFEVHTPSTVALAKGTRFTVTADGDTSTVSVRRGLVGVRESNSVAREVLVHPGFGVTGGAGRPFALGLLNQNGDPWEAWSRGAAPSRPLERPPEAPAAPAGADGVQVTLRGAGDVTLQLVAERGAKRVRILGADGFEATLAKRDLYAVLRGNTASLGPQLLNMLRTREVTPATFAHQVLDNL